MNNPFVRFAVTALVLAGLSFAFEPAARADRQSRAEATAILTAGKWHFKGKHFQFDCVFDAKGTMTIEGFTGKDSTCKWKADYKEIVMTFSYYNEVLLFPIDPKGTSGIDAWGDEFTATMVGDVPAAVAAAAATPTPTPSGLDALKPVATPTPAVSTENKNAAIIALLTAKKWLFTGSNWSEKRTFNPDGTITVENNSNAASRNHWEISGNEVDLTFPSHKEVLSLPLDPSGTKGTDEYGFDTTAVQVSDTGPSSGGNSVFGKTSSGQ